MIESIEPIAAIVYIRLKGFAVHYRLSIAKAVIGQVYPDLEHSAKLLMRTMAEHPDCVNRVLL